MDSQEGPCGHVRFQQEAVLQTRVSGTFAVSHPGPQACGERTLSLCPFSLQRVILWSLLAERKGTRGAPGSKAGDPASGVMGDGDQEEVRLRNQTVSFRGWEEPQEDSISSVPWEN